MTNDRMSTFEMGTQSILIRNDKVPREGIRKICKEGGFEASAATHPCPVKPVSALAGSEPAPRGHDEGSGGFESFEAWTENLPNSRLQRSD